MDLLAGGAEGSAGAVARLGGFVMACAQRNTTLVQRYLPAFVSAASWTNPGGNVAAKSSRPAANSAPDRRPLRLSPPQLLFPLCLLMGRAPMDAIADFDSLEHLATNPLLRAHRSVLSTMIAFARVARLASDHPDARGAARWAAVSAMAKLARVSPACVQLVLDLAWNEPAAVRAVLADLNEALHLPASLLRDGEGAADQAHRDGMLQEIAIDAADEAGGDGAGRARQRRTQSCLRALRGAEQLRRFVEQAERFRAQVWPTDEHTSACALSACAC